MTFSTTDLPFAASKSATGFEPFMAAAFAPAMMTGAMMMQGYAFWLATTRSMMPAFDDSTATPLAQLQSTLDLATPVTPVTLFDMPKGIDVPETMGDMAGDTVAEAAPVPHDITASEAVAAEPVAPAPVASATEATKPEGLAAARDGKGDDLTLISGIGSKIARKLHDLGFYHWDQIAAWSANEVLWVDSFLDFKGRIAREDWVAQAEALAQGGVEEYVKRFGKEPR